jgi:phosphoglycerate dehydrogenase-like enzyme
MRPDVLASSITVTNSRGIHAIPMAEHTMGMILSFARKFPASLHYQRQHRWAQQEIWDARPRPTELKGSTLVIIGFGAIGTELAKRARAFGMRVWAVTRSGHADASLADWTFPAIDLAKVLPEADYIVLAAPDTPDTHHMIGASELAAMKPSACLVNVSRGGLVDESELVAALQNGTIAGAALDVAEHEPLSQESPLWQMENVFITPHTSSVSENLWPRQTELMLGNLDRWFSGRQLINLVDLARGY